MSPSRLSRYRAERLLRKDFAGLRSNVLAVVRSQLRSKGVELDTADLEACYAQAWQGLYATVLDGEEVENPSAWLVLVTFRRAIDEHRSALRNRTSAGAGAIGSEQSLGASDRDFAAELDDRERLRQVFEGMRAGLSERECEAASLCYLQGLSRAEAAARMDISEARMRKLMEGAGRGRPGVAGKVGELLDTIKAGGWCEQQSSLMRAFAFGVLDPQGERHALAVAHCRECPACRAHVASLRGLASVLPLLPGLALGGGPTRAGVAAKASSGVSGSLTVKLAVAGIVVLGTGYGVLGSRAHGSTPTHRIGTRSVNPSKPPLYEPQTSIHRAHVRSPRSSRGSSHAHTPSTRKAPSSRAASSYEFAPERVAGQPPPAKVLPPSRGAEFGFE
jgi:DNA-directed RNA polymerase specialized sigma24 family protein